MYNSTIGFGSIKKKKFTRLLPSEKRSCYMERFKIKAVLGVLRKKLPFRNEKERIFSKKDRKKREEKGTVLTSTYCIVGP